MSSHAESVHTSNNNDGLIKLPFGKNLRHQALSPQPHHKNVQYHTGAAQIAASRRIKSAPKPLKVPSPCTQEKTSNRIPHTHFITREGGLCLPQPEFENFKPAGTIAVQHFVK
jgi:hypothetical protein